MKKIYTVLGSNATSLGRKIANTLNAEVIDVSRKLFPDGELYVRLLSRVDSEATILLINSMYPRQNDSFLETLLLANAVKNSGGRRIVALIPYIAYSRQDKVFLEGEPTSIEVILKSLRASGIEDLVTLDIHNPRTLKYFEGASKNIIVSDELVKKALKYVEDPIVLAPDKGALERARYAAEKLGLEYDYLIKYRDRHTGEVSLKTKDISVSGRNIVIVDDIISTGGTISLAARECIKKGAKKVIVAVTHALLIKNAIEKLKNSGVLKLLTIESIPLYRDNEFIEIVDVSERIAKELKEFL